MLLNNRCKILRQKLNPPPQDAEGKSAADIHRELEEVNTKADLLRARAERVRGMIDGGHPADSQESLPKEMAAEQRVPRLDLRIKVNEVEKIQKENPAAKERVAKKLDYSFHSDTG